jgi:hypothetical protein
MKKMNVEITHISVQRATKVAAMIGVAFALPMGLFFAAVGLLTAVSTGSWWQAPTITLMPTLAMLIMTFVISSTAGALVPVVYNFIAPRWGGLEISMIETGRR